MDVWISLFVHGVWTRTRTRTIFAKVEKKNEMPRLLYTVYPQTQSVVSTFPRLRFSHETLCHYLKIIVLVPASLLLSPKVATIHLFELWSTTSYARNAKKSKVTMLRKSTQLLRRCRRKFIDVGGGTRIRCIFRQQHFSGLICAKGTVTVNNINNDYLRTMVDAYWRSTRNAERGKLQCFESLSTTPLTRSPCSGNYRRVPGGYVFP